MRRDPEQPGGELGGRLICTARTVDPQENFLRQFLGDCLVLHHTEQKVNHRGAVFLEQESEARTVSLFDPEHQLRVQIQNCRSRAYIRANPFGHSRLLSVLKIMCPPHSHSPLSERSIKRRMASWGEDPACNIWCIWAVIGISTWWRCRSP